MNSRFNKHLQCTQYQAGGIDTNARHAYRITKGATVLVGTFLAGADPQRCFKTGGSAASSGCPTLHAQLQR